MNHSEPETFSAQFERVNQAGVRVLGQETVILNGLTVGAVIELLGYQYVLTERIQRPPRYGRKWLTTRALRWRQRHRFTIEHVLTLEPVHVED